MLWRMSADPRARKLGVMSSHRLRKVCSARPSRLAGVRHQPCAAGAERLRELRKLPKGAISRISGVPIRCERIPGRPRALMRNIVSYSCRCRSIRQIREGAERAERSETPGTRQLPAALTLRTPLPRLPGQCSSGPFRSELSARSADRGRVVPVLDRFSGRSPIAPFAPSFP